MSGHQITMPWDVKNHPSARQTGRDGQPGRPGMVDGQSVSVVLTRLEVGLERIREARAAGQATQEAELRWAALFARWAAAVGLSFYGAEDAQAAWLAYADECEGERK